MPFHAELLKETEQARMGLLSAPIIQGCLQGVVSPVSYTHLTLPTNREV